ncbi:MAG: GNAT family N-acetyltransferase [Bacteroidota bacterium]|nr:GNAT family N-acetyltransferase [Bacteroidota bacterium]
MKVIIRKGEKEDIPAVLALIKELALFEKAPHEVTNTEADMMKDGFGHSPVYKLQVAEVDGFIAGMAIYFIKYSTWKGKGIYLDDIVVNERYRGKGIGKKLLDAVITDSFNAGAKQLHWQVLDWNEPAIGFYRKYESAMDTEWINCKLDHQQIEQLAKKIKEDESI